MPNSGGGGTRMAPDHRPLALLVDRDLDTRAMYAEFLRRDRWEIDEAEDGREALAKALARHPDVIITETRLPGINGVDLCRLLRQDADTAATPIVVVTGDAFPADLKQARAAGATEVLVKPCLPADLLMAIRRQLQLSAQRPQLVDAGGDPIADSAPGEVIVEPRARGPSRAMLNKAHHRHDTTEPPAVPPLLRCPTCDQPLTYMKSHVGGVSARHPEQWDDFECSAGCGAFQYRQRTRKLRRVQ
jgi:CheY-like chemotaxis protein